MFFFFWLALVCGDQFLVSALYALVHPVREGLSHQCVDHIGYIGSGQFQNFSTHDGQCLSHLWVGRRELQHAVYG